MILVLQRSPEQETALRTLLDQQHGDDLVAGSGGQ
jgi:hypothetical protein